MLQSEGAVVAYWYCRISRCILARCIVPGICRANVTFVLAVCIDVQVALAIEVGRARGRA